MMKCLLTGKLTGMLASSDLGSLQLHFHLHRATEDLPELEEGERHKGKDVRKNIICCKIKGKKYKCC